MAYSPFPVGYQPYIPQQVQMQNNNSQSLIWVQGEAGAKSYLVAPNSVVPLWDSEAQTIYIKSADASGMPSMKIIDYTVRDVAKQTPAIAENNYVTHDEFEAFRNEIKKQLEVVKDE